MVAVEVVERLTANGRFAEDLTRILTVPGTNFIFSPLQIHALLLLLSEDPGYHSKVALQRLLHTFFSETKPSQFYKEILNIFNSESNVNNLITAGKVFFKDKHKLRESFKEFIQNNFLYETCCLDFTKSDPASASINTWIEEKTERKIKNLIKSDHVDKDTRLLFLDTFLVNGKWSVPFEIENITPGTFYINENDTVDVEMMKTKGEFKSTVDYNRGLKYLELPFENPNISLLIILPSPLFNKAELDSVTHFDLTTALNNTSRTEMLVTIPKFIFEGNLDIGHFINKSGFKNEVFDDAYLFGMLDGDEFLRPNNIQHKALIDVNENGVIATSGTSVSTVPNTMEETETAPKDGIVIYDMSVKSDVSNRFAKTLVTCKVKNTEKSPKEANFFVILPETAFITEFIMEIQGKSYKSYIKEKEEAKQIYQAAVHRGQGAGLVERSARDSNKFTVSVNLEPNSVAVFLLTYEEMLQRVHDRYELVLNIRPQQFVETLNVEVNIYESKPLKFVKTPPLRSGNEMSQNEEYLEPESDIKIINKKTAVVKFSPDLDKQKRLVRYLQSSFAEGFSGQFVVQYDVERDPQDGEILLQDGYFVHFFAPNDLDPLPKHVVFVLDTSGSMSGRKIRQLKNAMGSILNEIRKNDIIDIVEFSSSLVAWDIDSVKKINLPYDYNFTNSFVGFSDVVLPNPTFASETTIKNAKAVVEKISAGGGTFMIGGLLLGLYLVKVGQEKIANRSEKYQPIIIFLTDGQPNVGVSSTEEIVRIVSDVNSKTNKVPIFSLSFGTGADRAFLRKLSLKNMGFSRHIYEAADASLQLQEFYKQISSPLLSNITFKYDTEVEEVTKTCFPIFFRGSELVVSGRYKGPYVPAGIDCFGRSGPVIIKSLIERPVTSLERLWAYLTVKQLLEERNTVENKEELTKKAVALALKYSFVTDVTSLVVVKPEVTQAADIESNIQEIKDAADPFGGYVRPMLCTGNINFFRKKCLASMPPAPPGSGVCFGSVPSGAIPSQQSASFENSLFGAVGFGTPQATASSFVNYKVGGPPPPKRTSSLRTCIKSNNSGANTQQSFGAPQPPNLGANTQRLAFGAAQTQTFGAPTQQQLPFGAPQPQNLGESQQFSFGMPPSQIQGGTNQSFSFGTSQAQNSGAKGAQQSFSFGTSQAQNSGAKGAQQSFSFGTSQAQNSGAKGAQQSFSFGTSQAQNSGAKGAQQSFSFGTSQAQNSGAKGAQQSFSFGTSQAQNSGGEGTQQSFGFGTSQAQNSRAEGAQQSFSFGTSQSQNQGAGTGFTSIFGNSQGGSFFQMPQSQTQMGGNLFGGNMNVPSTEFTVNRPFLFALTLKEDSQTIVLFKGRIENPLCKI